MIDSNYIYKGTKLNINKNVVPAVFRLQDYKTDNVPVLIARKPSEISDTWVPHRHNYYELLIVLSGEVLHYFNGTTYHLKEQNICLIRANDVHFYVPHPDFGSFYIINCAFPMNIFEETEEFLNLKGFDAPDRPLDIWKVEEDHKLTSYLKLIEAIEGHQLTYSQKERTFKLLLSDVLNNMANNLIESGAAVPYWLSSSCEQMKKYGNILLGLDRFIELSGKSQEHVTRAMKKFYGITPSKFINQLRLQEAGRQLATTKNPITSIALDVGYNTMSYFNEAFRKEYGVSPRDYRKIKYSFV